MTNKKKILIIGGLILLGQIYFLRDYISPIQWGQIKVSGLACTCPDESVLNGQLYLRSITPDSLTKYDLDYSEIYVTEKPATAIDPMGADYYMVKGQVIGKDRVSKTDPWNPVVDVEEWREVDIIWDWLIKILFCIQALFLFLITRGTSKNGA